MLSGVLWYALLQVHFMLAAAANTVFVLLAFHFLSPQDGFVIGERVLDTLLASSIALICSRYVLPWWESNYMGSLAAALRRANLRFLQSGLRYAGLTRRLHALEQQPQAQNLETQECRTAQHEAELQWRVDRKNMHIAFGNYAGAFYRMMDEPVRRQHHVKTLNSLMTQHHTLASHISASVPLLADMEDVPPDTQRVLDGIEATLAGANDGSPQTPLSARTAEFAVLAYPLRQMQSASTLIAQHSEELADSTAAAL